MSDMSDYLEIEIIKHIFRTGSFTKPTVLAIALCTAAPTDSDTGSTITEPAGGSYARVDVPPDNSNWSDPGASSGQTDNVADITFPTATGDWGVITHVAFIDATSAGNMLLHKALASSKNVETGDTFKFSIGDLDTTMA